MLKPEPVRRQVVVGYSSQQALRQALAKFPARIVQRLPQLGAVSVDPEMHRDHFAAGVSALPGITFVNGLHARRFHSEPALVVLFRPGLPYEWQYVATRTNEVPDSVLRAAAGVKIAVIDTGADLRHPDLAAKSPETWDIVRKRTDVRDLDGHGTFVSTLAAGSVSNDEGIAGFGGDAKLLIIKASGQDGMFTEVDEAAAIVYAVDHGAKVINLSIGGEGTSIIEKRAVDYAANRNVLLVAAGGNEYEDGNPIEYPAALLQPPGSRGQGGVGLVVGATTMAGKRAYFSNTGSHISLAAPGDSVFGAVATTSAARDWPRYALPGSKAGLYGWSSGTSFSTPQVAGAAALVWAANPSLTAQQVAGVLKTTASGRGRWNLFARLRRHRRRLGRRRCHRTGHPGARARQCDPQARRLAGKERSHAQGRQGPPPPGARQRVAPHLDAGDHACAPHRHPGDPPAATAGIGSPARRPRPRVTFAGRSASAAASTASGSSTAAAGISPAPRAASCGSAFA